MIKLQIIGNLGKDAIVNNVNGKTVINFTVCHTEKYKDNNGVDNQRSVWCDCSYWSEKTAVAQYLKKGTQIFVEGNPDVRVYTANGRTGASLTVRVGQIQLLGGKKEDNGSNSHQTSSNQYSNPDDITDIDPNIPF